MIRITVRRDGRGVWAVEASGHSGYAESGSDIVCAAASSLMQALWLGLDEVIALGDELQAEQFPDTATIKLVWHTDDDRAHALAETVVRSLKAIGSSYERYLDIEEIFCEEGDHQ